MRWEGKVGGWVKEKWKRRDEEEILWAGVGKESGYNKDKKE